MFYSNEIDRRAATPLGSSNGGALDGAKHSEATLSDLFEAASGLRGRVAEVLASVGISYSWYGVLARLRAARAPVALRSLGRDVRGAHEDLGEVLDELEVAGHVRRADIDGVLQVELTQSGAELALEGALQMDIVRLEFAAAFPARDRAALGRLLARVGGPEQP